MPVDSPMFDLGYQHHSPSLSSSHLAVRLHHPQIWFLPPRNPHRGSQLRWSFRQLLVENCARTHSRLPKLDGRSLLRSIIAHGFIWFYVVCTAYNIIENHGYSAKGPWFPLVSNTTPCSRASFTARTHSFADHNFPWGDLFVTFLQWGHAER